MRTMDELFEREPAQWELRGDSKLWHAIAERLKGRPVPTAFYEVRYLIEEAFEAETGVTMASDHDEIILYREREVSRRADAMVKPAAWRETFVPILIDRASAG